jgi:small subunit ribosomal protein S9
MLEEIVVHEHFQQLNRVLLRSFSSRAPPPPRLRFPPGFDSLAPRGGDQDRFRTHAITLFPGDFKDDGDSLFDSDYLDDREAFAERDAADEDTDKIIEELKFLERQDAAKKQRWLDNNEPPVRVSEIDERGRAYGRGGRKTASARVWIQPGFGQVLVNRKPFVDYFTRESDRDLVLEPFVATETCGKFDVTIMVQGGGLTGQAGAARHGAANALNHYNPDTYRFPLKRLGLLTRDARMVERKVVGRVKARKSPQWVRR